MLCAEDVWIMGTCSENVWRNGLMHWPNDIRINWLGFLLEGKGLAVGLSGRSSEESR